MSRYWWGIVVVVIAAMAEVVIAADAPTHLLVVRPCGSWPPWEIVSENGDLTGVHIELVTEAARALNLSVTIETYPWKRAIEMLKDGQADAITYMTKTEERKHYGVFVDGNALSASQIGFFVLHRNYDDIRFNGDLGSLAGYTIGTCRGYSYEEGFDTADYLTKDDGAIDEKALLQKLMAKRFKIAVGYVNDIKYNAKQMGLSQQITFLKPFLADRRVVYLVFSKARHHDALARRFADAMVAFKTSPAYRELLDRYGADYCPLILNHAEAAKP
ncbi:hypothetical protein JCM14469_42840 [Desulfatiferula olefinivorans]